MIMASKGLKRIKRTVLREIFKVNGGITLRLKYVFHIANIWNSIILSSCFKPKYRDFRPGGDLAALTLNCQLRHWEAYHSWSRRIL